jgi:ferredoxin-NADP reductase/Na+-translocating ferredoxin:NAD+ oxidoreductase RnfD subunit
MFRIVDKWLNQITMYRLVIYYVFGLWVAGFVLSFFNIFPFSPWELLVSGFFICLVSIFVNTIFAKAFNAPSNAESVYATVFFLALITPPMQSVEYLPFVGWVAVWAMASKYIFAINKKHLFNPAAFAVAVTVLTLGRGANWWVSSVYMLPLVVIGGVLLVRKIRRFDLVASFFAVALISIVVSGYANGSNPVSVLEKVLLYSPILFFGLAMLTEPATTPPTRNLRIMYGVLVGILFNPSFHIGSFYFTPELALIAGNIFSYAVSPKLKLVMKLKEKVLSAANVYDFWFETDKKLQFKPGQYLEWTLGHESQDIRGIRRYITIASSPTEDGIMAGVKFYPNPSTFKQSMMFLNPGDTIVGSQLAGDFTLPKDKNKKLVFIAGGIGVTPFRSMIKYLIDTKEKRDIVMLYCNRTVEDIAYKDIFDTAEKELGIKTVHTITDCPYPENWKGKCGFIDEAMIRECVPDFKERTFYLSGTHGMVVSFTDILSKMGLKKSQIIKDFFPGFA